jgi:hypothetical protein
MSEAGSCCDVHVMCDARDIIRRRTSNIEYRLCVTQELYLQLTYDAGGFLHEGTFRSVYVCVKYHMSLVTQFT